MNTKNERRGRVGLDEGTGDGTRHAAMRRGLRPAVQTAALALLGAAIAWTACSHRPPRPNIVLVVLDTVRDDYVGPGFGGESNTPVLDGLARGGTTFTDVCANAPWTVPSHASIFSGLLPSSHQCTGMSYRFDVATPTFAELLTDAGYQAAAFYSNPWLTDRLTGMCRGFEQYCSGPEDDTDIFRRGEQGGPETIRNLANWFSRRDRSRPFLVFVNFLEPHLPYDPPVDYRRQHLEDLPPDVVFETRWALEFNAGVLPAEDIDFDEAARLYAGDIHTADGYLGDVLRLLGENAPGDNTVVIVTSDHGENLGDHGYMDHQFGLFETLVEVPLIIKAPRRLAPGVRDDPVMLTDIYDTILDLARVEGGPDTPHSRSLIGPPAGPDRPLISEYAGANMALLRALRGLNPDLDSTRLELAFSKVRVDTLEFTVASDGSRTLYDLAADPGRMHNLALERPGQANVLLDLMPLVKRVDERDVEMDEDMREWLRSLGYIR